VAAALAVPAERLEPESLRRLNDAEQVEWARAARALGLQDPSCPLPREQRELLREQLVMRVLSDGARNGLAEHCEGLAARAQGVMPLHISLDFIARSSAQREAVLQLARLSGEGLDRPASLRMLESISRATPESTEALLALLHGFTPEQRSSWQETAQALGVRWERGGLPLLLLVAQRPQSEWPAMAAAGTELNLEAIDGHARTQITTALLRAPTSHWHDLSLLVALECGQGYLSDARLTELQHEVAAGLSPDRRELAIDNSWLESLGLSSYQRSVFAALEPRDRAEVMALSRRLCLDLVPPGEREQHFIALLNTGPRFNFEISPRGTLELLANVFDHIETEGHRREELAGPLYRINPDTRAQLPLTHALGEFFPAMRDPLNALPREQAMSVIWTLQHLMRGDLRPDQVFQISQRIAELPEEAHEDLARRCARSRQRAAPAAYLASVAVESARLLDLHGAARRATVAALTRAALDPENVMRGARIAATARSLEALTERLGAPGAEQIEAAPDAAKALVERLRDARAIRAREARHAIRTLEGGRLPGDFSEAIRRDEGDQLDGTPVRMRALLALVQRGIAALESAPDRANAETSLALSLSRCIEDDGHRVCTVGISQRLLGVLQGYYPEVDLDLATPGALLSQLMQAFHREHGERPSSGALQSMRETARQEGRERFAEGSVERTVFESDLAQYLEMTYPA
jgi:hypothetical protein